MTDVSPPASCPHLANAPASCSRTVLLAHRFPLPTRDTVTLHMVQPHLTRASETHENACEPLMEAVDQVYQFVSETEARRAVNTSDWLEFEDAFQESRIALMRATVSYCARHASRASFATYARTCVRRALRDVVHWGHRDLARASAGAQVGTIVALATGGADIHLPHALPSSVLPDAAETLALMNLETKTVHTALTRLPAREQAIIWLIYADGWSLRQVAAHLHLSRTRCHQLHQQALTVLREELVNALAVAV